MQGSPARKLRSWRKKVRV